MLQENIQANISQDTITLEFLKSDGTEIIQFIDMKNVSVAEIARVVEEIVFRNLSNLFSIVWVCFENFL